MITAEKTPAGKHELCRKPNKLGYFLQIVSIEHFT